MQSQIENRIAEYETTIADNASVLALLDSCVYKGLFRAINAALALMSNGQGGVSTLLWAEIDARVRTLESYVQDDLSRWHWRQASEPFCHDRYTHGYVINLHDTPTKMVRGIVSDWLESTLATAPKRQQVMALSGIGSPYPELLITATSDGLEAIDTAVRTELNLWPWEQLVEAEHV